MVAGLDHQNIWSALVDHPELLAQFGALMKRLDPSLPLGMPLYAAIHKALAAVQSVPPLVRCCSSIRLSR